GEVERGKHTVFPAVAPELAYLRVRHLCRGWRSVSGVPDHSCAIPFDGGLLRRVGSDFHVSRRCLPGRTPVTGPSPDLSGATEQRECGPAAGQTAGRGLAHGETTVGDRHDGPSGSRD